MKKINNWSLFSILLTLASIIGTLCIYSKLPNMIPTHFGIDGAIDKMGPKSDAFITAFLPLFFAVLLFLLPKIDPKKKAYTLHKKAYNIFYFVLTLFIILIHWASLLFSLGYNISVPFIVKISLGILFLVIGNYMPQIRQNYSFGIKTPWSLDDERNWRSTHRFGSYMFIIIGIIFIVASFFTHNLVSILCFSSLLIGVTSTYVYSYVYYKKSKN